MRILVVRPDRIGDVILSIPVFKAIKKKYPTAWVGALVQPGLVEIIERVSEVNEIIPVSARVLHLSREIRRGKYDVAVILQSQFPVDLAIFLARIPKRIGPKSKAHSYLLYTQAIRQKRSEVQMHEADYNLQLLEALDIHTAPQAFDTSFERPEPHGGSFIAIHPGMGGSALNWPLENYEELVRTLIDRGRKVLITAGPQDHILIAQLRKGLADVKGVTFANPRTLAELGSLFMSADAVVAPSTGPLHLAGALGRPVLGFYSPVRVQSARRWGPYASDPRKTAVMTPGVSCPGTLRCLGDACRYYSCMREITVPMAIAELDRISKP